MFQLVVEVGMCVCTLGWSSTFMAANLIFLGSVRLYQYLSSWSVQSRKNLWVMMSIKGENINLNVPQILTIGIGSIISVITLAVSR